MSKSSSKATLLTFALATVVFISGAGADEIKLPDMGSPADAILSANDEVQIGRSIMRDIRNSGQVVEDPLVNEYINEVGNKVAAQTNDGDHDFTFFVIDDHRINAFALPGGYIGVHTGLLEASRSEDELAGVLAHEVAHVTQRHIARAIHANSRQSLLSTAIMLGAMIAGAAGGGGDVMQAGIAVAQGTAAQQQINFTRSNEHEADRVGIAALADAGFDPYGMASFFDVMSRQDSRAPDERAPEFLRTHPVTSSRIAEARNRARNYPQVRSEDSISYGISKIRTIIDRFETPKEAVAYFEKRCVMAATERLWTSLRISSTETRKSSPIISRWVIRKCCLGAMPKLLIPLRRPSSYFLEMSRWLLPMASDCWSCSNPKKRTFCCSTC
jgi:predicted Zn-dependent protease